MENSKRASAARFGGIPQFLGQIFNDFGLKLNSFVKQNVFLVSFNVFLRPTLNNKNPIELDPSAETRAPKCLK